MNSPDNSTPRENRRRIRYTIGSLLALIAGLAVMLGVLVPFIKVANSPLMAPPSHVGLTTASVNAKNCASCHAGMPARSIPPSFQHP
jgi:hypothetical protein